MERYLVAVIGAGFAGLGLAIRLRQAGIEDFVVLERAETLGGVWRDNVYPGVACDVPVHLYSYSFEPNPSWTRLFAPQSEILAYLEHCAEKYGVQSKIRFGAGVSNAVWDEDHGVWRVTTADGKTIEARALVCAAGLALTKPILPKIAGIETFDGSIFHSSRWDANAKLEDVNVAVIGTGASAIQIVPEVAKVARKLHVFQRTAPWVVPRVEQRISRRAQEIFRRRPIVQKAARSGLYWIMEALGTGFIVDKRVNVLRERLAKRFIARKIKDPVLREKVTPKYTLGCKRVLFSSAYYPALVRPNVELVTDRIREIRGRTIVTDDGTSREVDAIVCATGFEAAEATLSFELSGRDGITPEEAWTKGSAAYLGTSVPGFPNFFFIIGPNTGLGHSSIILMMESQYPYVVGAIRRLAKGDVASLEVKADRARRYNEALQKRLAKSVWSTGGCTSWYTTKDGVNTTLWPGFTWEFRLRLRRFDADAYEERGWASVHARAL